VNLTYTYDTLNHDYDKAYRLTALVTKNSGGTVVDAWSYGYDAVRNRATKTDAQGRVDHYGYDEVYRLTEAEYGDGGREGFTYDAVGNRVTRTAYPEAFEGWAYWISGGLVLGVAETSEG
jgi:YD repeat-containing protein